MTTVTKSEARGRASYWLALAGGLAAFAVLVALGTWQVQRLAWKEGLLATIDGRVHSPPLPLGEVEAQFDTTGDVEYQPVTAKGRFVHDAERHFFATHHGASGYYVYTPLALDDGRYVFVNRGFVPYDRKDAATRTEGQVDGPVGITGLARNPLAEKPSSLVPDNEPAKNIFYWKDRDRMAATSGLPGDARVLPFFIDADDTPNPGGLPVGGVTIINLPNSHLQYALTWYGLAAALVAVLGTYLWRNRKSGPGRP
ncbi:SURF1 family protein [Mesorhizobium xinjiangense]|uniref:SURF1 family protein n=1 Tax=Mesorhizobium xinjiangense TaxID=2678685 RepID=UPI0012ECC217|nr:SURF1 family protein [Mesorhizobium xinjiangense]